VKGVVQRPAGRVSFAKELRQELLGGLPLFTEKKTEKRYSRKPLHARIPIRYRGVDKRNLARSSNHREEFFSETEHILYSLRLE
jgi:hypothetical protein